MEEKIMKKLVFFAAVAAIALTSCQEEKSYSEGATGENDVAFALQSLATKAEGSASSVKNGISVALDIVDGVQIYLDETITDLNFAPETKGAPAYTENVGYLYQDKLGVHTDAAGGVDATFARLTEKTSEGWCYCHKYSENIWPDETTPVQFYLRMPSDMDSHGVTSLAYASGVTTVGYTSPTTAAAQQDILFGGIQMNHKKYMGSYYPQGAPVTLYHALTGIKFAIKNTAAELADIQVNKISFIGLKNTGTFTFTAPGTFNWTSATAVDENVISQTFEAGDLVTYDATTHAGNNFADSFYAAGTSQNLNKADASYTFWLIPQSITNSDAILKIEYTASGKDEAMEIRLGDLHASTWNAGQLRTYTFRLDEVNVMIDDTVTMADKTQQNITTPWGPKVIDSYENSTKTNVVITNTGNTDAFIRAAIVGQWLNGSGDPIFGFTDYTHGIQLVDSWYLDQFSENPPQEQGKFTGLPGTNWVKGDDGYYYYTDPVPAGEDVPNNLFTEYKVGKVPGVAVAGNVQDIHFSLEIATQAISARKLDGTLWSSYTLAWDNAKTIQ